MEDKIDQLLDKGLEFENKDQFENALEQYQEVLKLQPDNLVALIKGGDAYYILQRYDEAIAVYLNALPICRVLELLEQEIWILEFMIKIYHKNKNYEEAIKRSQEALIAYNKMESKTNVIEEEKILLLYSIAELYEEIKEDEKAMAVYRTLHQLHTKLNNPHGLVEVLISMGNIHVRQNQFKEALEVFSQALQLSKEKAESYLKPLAQYELASVYYQLKQFKKAYPLLKEVELYHKVYGLTGPEDDFYQQCRKMLKKIKQRNPKRK